MTKKLFFALALMVTFFFGGLVYETASAGQNDNRNNMRPEPGMSTSRRHHRRHHRRWHRRGRMGRMPKNSNT